MRDISVNVENIKKLDKILKEVEFYYTETKTEKPLWGEELSDEYIQKYINIYYKPEDRYKKIDWFIKYKGNLYACDDNYNLKKVDVGIELIKYVEKDFPFVPVMVILENQRILEE